MKKGVDTKTKATVALKFMARAQDEWAVDQAEQVRTEIKSLTEIRHENVMTLYAYNLSAKYPTTEDNYIKTILLVLEYCPGGEIFDILYYSEKIDVLCARTYLHQMINGLEACHKAGVAHRDIKPQNLLLDSDFQLKITDFGLSKIIEKESDLIMRTTYVGTRGYQAPELLNNKKYKPNCDIFSMGVVVFIMLCGYPPFERAHKTDRWYKPLTKADTAGFWKGHRGCGIPEECKDLVTGMLCYKPRNRITLDEIKAHKFWSNGKTLGKEELKKRILLKYEEARKARAKDPKKMDDLARSVSNLPRDHREVDGHDHLTPEIDPLIMPELNKFETPITDPSFKTMEKLRLVLVKLFPTIEFTRKAGEDTPYEFKFTIVHEIKDSAMTKFKIRHTAMAFVRRDAAAARNVLFFKLIQSGERLQWIKIWKKIFNAIHEYGVVAELKPLGLKDVKSDGALAKEPRPPMPSLVTASKSEPVAMFEEENKEDERVLPGGGMMCGLMCGGGMSID